MTASTTKGRQISQGSNSAYGYTSDDDSTIGDAEGPPATTSDERPGVSETKPEKAESPIDDNMDMEHPLPHMLLDLRDMIVKEKIAEKLLKAAEMAESMVSLYNEDDINARLRNLEADLGRQIAKKNGYRKQMERLQAERDEAKGRAMKIFG